MGSDTYTVQRDRHLDAPPGDVRERIVDLRRWTSWSPWEDLDPHLRRTYGGPTSGAGAWYEWDGNRKAGSGRMEIVGADDSSVTIDVRFVRPFKSRGTITFTLEPAENATFVTWTMTGPRPFALKVMGLFVSMDKMIGPDFEKGLDRLKADVEGSPAA